MKWKYNDGGRADAGFKGQAGDCVARAIAIASGEDYRQVYNDLAALNKKRKGTRSARNGIDNRDIRTYLLGKGWTWTPTMKVGQGCKVHLREDELPSGRLMVSVSKHMVAVIDGVAHDTHDPSRGGSRCVYGYFSKK